MDQKDFEKLEAEGKVEVVKEEETSFDIEKKKTEQQNQDRTINEEELQPILETLRRILKPVDTAPTKIPKSFLDQIVIYKNGSTYRLYIYVEDAWRYTALT